jgi:uncharacterized protein (DUF1778 family)
MTIDKKTNMPTHIPIRATEKIDIRCYPHTKTRIKELAEANNSSISKVVLEALEIYLN